MFNKLALLLILIFQKVLILIYIELVGQEDGEEKEGR